MSNRCKRKVQSSPEVPPKVPRRWREVEIETLLKCIMKYGHKNLKKLEEHLPGRSNESIKAFLRTAHDRACRSNSDDILDRWIQLCNSSEPPWGDCLQIAQVLKYLSVDGLVENHPLPGSCQGVDFSMAYRLIYQALMGYPIQPVNKPTADFVLDTLSELQSEMKKQMSAITNVQSFFRNKHSTEQFGFNAIKSQSLNDKQDKDSIIKKPLRVYQRKKQSMSNSEMEPCLKIIVEESSSDSGVGPSKDFSLTVEGYNSCRPTIIKVPVPFQVNINKDEEELLKSSSYNPFQIPGKWLEEPLHLNLVVKL